MDREDAIKYLQRKNIIRDNEVKNPKFSKEEEDEIKEHTFTQSTFIIKKKKGKEDYIPIVKTKKKRNIMLWYAKFYFKEIPKNGWLKVMFR